MRYWCRIVFVSLLAVVSASTYAAESAPVRLCSAEWPGFINMQNHQASSGVTYDVLVEAFRRIGRSVTMDEVPWARCLKSVTEGVNYDGATDEFFPHVDPHVVQAKVHYNSAPFGICVKANYPDRPLSLTMLQGQVVGSVRGYIYTPGILAHTGWDLYPTKDEEQLYAMLEHGRYTYIICDYWSSLNRPNVRMLRPILDVTELGVLYNAKHADLRDSVDTAVVQMLRDGTVEAIYKKYMGNDYVPIAPTGTLLGQ
jgi:hypothetical protein